MFTGLIATTGTLISITPTGGAKRLLIAAPELAGRWTVGDSIAVNGVCLTAIPVADPANFAADLATETLERTTLAALTPGATVNLELPTPAGSPLGGHVVQGHVDAVGTVASVAQDGFARRLEIEAPAEVLRYVVHKGSVAVDGVSLTIAELGERSFTVSLIPETLERTSLGTANAGTRVNLEVDVLAKYVERLMEAAR